MRGEIPTSNVRKAFERSGVTKGQLAERLGWTRPNIDKVNRALGMRPDTSNGTSRPKPRELMTYELARQICEAINASPYEVGV